ncbi:hypothetical protein QQS21_011666, partial [Conoideocrella luteorostrata]
MLLPSTLAALAASAAAFPTSTFSIAQKLAGAPQGWARHDDAKVDKASSMIKLRIQLSQPRISEFHELAMK